MSSLATGLVPGAESLDYTKAGNMIEVMYKFQSSTWNELVDKMPKLESVVNNTMSEVSHLNNFLGVDIGAHPWNLLTDALAAASIARSYYRSTDSGTCRFDTVYQRETFTGRRRWSGNE